MDTFQTYGVRIIIPFIFIAIGILSVRLGRKDGDKSPMKNTLCVGTSVMLMCLSVIISDGISQLKSQSISPSGSYWAFLIILILLIFWSIDNDRYDSWERDDDGRPTDGKKLWRGILAPNILAILIFVGYQSRMDWL